MGDEQKPQASFLRKAGAPAAAPPAAPAQANVSQAGPAATGQSASFLAKSSMSAMPATLNNPPSGVRSPSLLSGKLKMPGSKTKSVLLRAASMPKMSAIRPNPVAPPAVPAMMRPGGASLANVQAAKAPEPDAPEQNQPEEQQAPGKSPAEARAEAETFLQQGLDHYDRGEFDQAVGSYKQAIMADPTFAMAHNNLGMVLIDLERYDEALGSLYESIHRDANYGEAYNNLGFVLRRQGNNAQAAAAYRKFLDLEPDVEEGERISGWIDQVISETGVAVLPPLEMPERAPEKPAVSADPPKIKKMAAWEVAAGNDEMAVPMNALGEYVPGAIQEQHPSQAAAAHASAPSHAAVPSHDLGRVSQNINKSAIILRTQQVPALGSAVSRKPGAPVTPEDRNRSVNLVENSLDEFANGNLEQAESLARQALDADPDNSEAHTSLGKILVRLEKLKEGIEHLEKAIALAPLDPAPYYVLGFTLRAMERNVEAAEIYETFLRLMPDAIDGAKMRQWIMHVKGVNEADQSTFEDDGFEDLEPIVTETDRAYEAALEKFKTCDGAQTVEECGRILQEAPDHARTYVLLGRAHMRLGDFDRAIDAFSRALELRPDFAEAQYLQGQCHEKSGDSPKALKVYRKYVENFPDAARTEKLRAWFLAHGLAETGKGLSQHIQCEWCLRFFDEGEISLHESKATCNGCLTLMGSTPIQDAAKLETVEGAEGAQDAPAHKRKGGTIRKLFLFGTGTAAALVALGYFTNLLDPYLAMAGINRKKAAPVAVAPGPVGPVVATTDTGTETQVPVTVVAKNPVISPRFDGTKVKIVNAPEKDFSVFSRWVWKPELEGVSELDDLPNWKKEFFLKDRPLGMAVEEGAVVWTSESKDFEALKRGERFNVELTIKGYWIGPEGARKDLFSTSKSFTVATQFGYDVGSELDLGLVPEARNIDLLSVDANGDGLKDLIVTHGSLGQGAAQIMYGTADGSKQMTTLAEGARFSAACPLPLNGKESAGVLTANWQSGEVKLFLTNNARLDAGATAKFAPGIVAVAAMETERNKAAVAAFSGSAGALLVSTYDVDSGFGPVVSIPMPGGGGKGQVMAWKSADLGLGFLVVTPLAEDPLRFVPYNKGEWDKAGNSTVRSPMKDEGVITATVAVTCAQSGARRLALVVGGKTSRIMLVEEKAGKFTQVGSKTALPGPGLGVTAWDFNKDGCDDLFVVMRDEVGFYFLDENGGLLQGPHFPNPSTLGPVVLLGHGVARPDIAVLNENKKARVFKSAGVERTSAPSKATAVTNGEIK